VREKESRKRLLSKRSLVPVARAYTLLLGFSGNWRADGNIPFIEELKQLHSSRPPVTRITFDVSGLGEWDSVFLVFLLKIVEP
jgi:hypothetical protein